MLERVVDNWLTSANERSYEIPFAQLLISEGYRVLHGPVHHPFEHGKDIVALSPDGSLHAFQLKAGDLSLAALEEIQAQLFALSATAVNYRLRRLIIRVSSHLVDLTELSWLRTVVSALQQEIASHHSMTAIARPVCRPSRLSNANTCFRDL